MIDRLETALLYGSLGFKVFPLNATRTPITLHGFHDASSDEDQIYEWFYDKPDLNIGMAHSGWLIIDVDVHRGKPGLEEYAKIAHLTPEPLATVRTVSGGMHLHCCREGWPYKRKTDYVPGVDFLAGDGGYVTVPPSEGYTWERGGIEDLHAHLKEHGCGDVT